MATERGLFLRKPADGGQPSATGGDPVEGGGDGDGGGGGGGAPMDISDDGAGAGAGVAAASPVGEAGGPAGALDAGREPLSLENLQAVEASDLLGGSRRPVNLLATTTSVVRRASVLRVELSFFARGERKGALLRKLGINLPTFLHTKDFAFSQKGLEPQDMAELATLVREHGPLPKVLHLCVGGHSRPVLWRGALRAAGASPTQVLLLELHRRRRPRLACLGASPAAQRG